MDVIEWMIENNLAQNKWQAENIARGLQLEGQADQIKQDRCRVYREWRRSGENTKAAFAAALDLKSPPARLFETETGQ